MLRPLGNGHLTTRRATHLPPEMLRRDLKSRRAFRTLDRNAIRTLRCSCRLRRGDSLGSDRFGRGSRARCGSGLGGENILARRTTDLAALVLRLYPEILGTLWALHDDRRHWRLPRLGKWLWELELVIVGVFFRKSNFVGTVRIASRVREYYPGRHMTERFKATKVTQTVDVWIISEPIRSNATIFHSGRGKTEE